MLKHKTPQKHNKILVQISGHVLIQFLDNFLYKVGFIIKRSVSKKCHTPILQHQNMTRNIGSCIPHDTS